MLLVVDDNAEIRESLTEYLEKNGFSVDQAEDASAGRKCIAKQNYELIILDIMMPGEDGLSLCRHIHETLKTPVILLTAMNEDTDRIIGLELGADDYLTKPFNPRELLARIKAILRRSAIATQAGTAEHQSQNSECYTFGEWTLNVDQQVLSNESDKTISLSTGEFRLLIAFLEHPKRVLSRDQLLDIVSQRSAVAFDRSIDNQISRLRKKIETDPKQPQYIKTVWGGGYSFSYPVQRGNS